MRRRGRKKCCRRTSLSDLPRKVIDDILMCLPFRDAVTTSILLKKWRYMWRTLLRRVLERHIGILMDQERRGGRMGSWCYSCNFLNGLKIFRPQSDIMVLVYLWKPEEDLAVLTSNLEKIINHFLIFHVGIVSKFTLCVPYLDTCPNIDDLIHYLSRYGIQHLVLRLPIRGRPYKLPYSFFTCVELKHLTLQNCSVRHKPGFEGFHRLISLELCDVTISSNLLERLTSRCLLLEQLMLLISGASSNVIEINAPNLRSFYYTGNIRSVCFENIPLLAKLSLSHREFDVGAGKCNIANFPESFSALEHLHLNDMFFAAGAGEVPTTLSYDLYCVKHLCISSIYLSDSNEVSCALCLIRSFPNLQSMEIKVECDNNDIPALESLEVERFSDVEFNHLREVKLMQTNGIIPEIQLMKLLLAKSPELMKIVIEPCLVEDSATVKILAELVKFQRASPKAEVVYMLDKHPNPRPV